MTLHAHPAAKETIQQISFGVFLHALPDKDATRSSSDKCSKNIQKALKYVKNAMNTQKAIFDKPSPMSHDVSFDMSAHELTARASNTTTQKATENPKSYQTKSLDQIRLEQELAQVKADLALLKKQHSEPPRLPPPIRQPLPNLEQTPL